MSVIDRFTDDFAFLSNFYPAPVDFDGHTYPTVEHAYQAAKTLDPRERNVIRSAIRPGAAKRYGKVVTLRSDWDAVRLQVMEDLLRQKFAPTTRLLEALKRTAPATLIEGNTWGDRFWGQCHGRGENHLGRLLTEIRDGEGELLV